MDTRECGCYDTRRERAPRARPGDMQTKQTFQIRMMEITAVLCALVVLGIFPGCRKAAPGSGAEDDLAGMVRVAPATVKQGCGKAMICEWGEQGAQDARVPEFFIQETEVTNQEYADCVAAGKCRDNRAGDCFMPDELGRPVPGDAAHLPEGFAGADRPAACVSWAMARDYCKWGRKRLPAEVEWMAAAGADREFPWGSRPAPAGDKWNLFAQGRARLKNLANAGQPVCCGPDGTDGFEGPAPVGRFPDGRAPSGALDMAGNVWEWTADCFKNDQNGRCAARTIKGGSWESPVASLRIRARTARAPNTRSADIGFRCVLSKEN